MECRDRKGQRCEVGGIISLASFIDEHHEALNYDLITRTHYDLDDLGGALSWSSLYSFIKNVGTDSALARDLGRSTEWNDTIKTNAILADIYDLLQVIHADLVSLITHGKKKAKVKPYPRPGADEDKKRKIGKGAMPLSELRNWIKERQKHG